jgi:hypothetical protein
MKDKLKNLIKEILLDESIDIYNLDKLKNFTNYLIKKEDIDDFQVIFSPKDSPNKYQLNVSNYYKQYVVTFGLVDDGIIKTSTEVNDKFVLNVLSTIFSLVRYYVDKYKVKKINFQADKKLRSNLYSLYLNKHFSDFEINKSDYNGSNQYILIKKDGK